MPTGLKTLAVSAALFAISLASTAQSQPVPGPDARVKVTEDYARLVALMRFCGRGRWSTSTIGG